jgi:hypothetical protein
VRRRGSREAMDARFEPINVNQIYGGVRVIF